MTAERAHLLVASLADGRHVALPLDAVDRLEEVSPDRVERIGAQEVVQYRGAILPIGRQPQDVYWYASNGMFTTSKVPDAVTVSGVPARLMVADTV